MKRVLLRSVYDAFDYVMDHYYPAGLAKEAVRFEAVSAGAAPAKDLPRIDTAPRDGMSDIYEI